MLLRMLKVGAWRLYALLAAKELSQALFSFAFRSSPFVHKFHYLFISPRRDLGIDLAPETMNALGNSNKFVRHTFGREFLIHLHGECVRHVGILRAVDQ